jgi:NADH-ubiquinone oxidoreductase chain 4
MLVTLFLLPLVGALIISTMSETTAGDLSRIKKTSLVFTLITFVLSMIMWSEFDSSSSYPTQYQFVSELSHTSFFSLRFGIDGISLFFVLLTTFTLPFCLLASWDNVRHSLKAYTIAFLVFEALSIAVFIVLDVIAFYVAFESVLIPLFLIVGIWGASEARVRASFLLFLYTLFGSLFMLLAFVAMYYTVGSTNFEVLSAADLSFEQQKILWLAIFLSFAIKTPLVPFHLWLVKAHTEAPVSRKYGTCRFGTKVCYIWYLAYFATNATWSFNAFHAYCPNNGYYFYSLCLSQCTTTNWL